MVHCEGWEPGYGLEVMRLRMLSRLRFAGGLVGIFALSVVLVVSAAAAPAASAATGRGGRAAALQQCAGQLGITVGSRSALSQLSADQRAALKQCLSAARNSAHSGTV